MPRVLKCILPADFDSFFFLPLYFGLFPPEGSWWVLTALVLRSVCVGISLPSVVLHWGDCCH